MLQYSTGSIITELPTINIVVPTCFPFRILWVFRMFGVFASLSPILLIYAKLLYKRNEVNKINYLTYLRGPNPVRTLSWFNSMSPERIKVCYKYCTGGQKLWIFTTKVYIVYHRTLNNAGTGLRSRSHRRSRNILLFSKLKCGQT
jgi:hypothetical protein